MSPDGLLATWVSSGRLFDFILLLVCVEAVALIALHRSTGRGIAPAALLPNLAAGATLVGALRLSQATAGPALFLLLTLSLLAHLCDLRSRWR